MAMEGLFDEKLCLNCGRKATQLCSACRSVVFCNATCQKAIWRKHKVECRELAASRPKPVKASPNKCADVEARLPVPVSKAEATPARADVEAGPQVSEASEPATPETSDGKASTGAPGEPPPAQPVAPDAKPAARLLAGWRGPKTLKEFKGGADAKTAPAKASHKAVVPPFLKFSAPPRGNAQSRRLGEELWAKGIVEYLDGAASNKSMVAGLKAFQASIDADPSVADRQYFTGCLLVTAGRVDEAIECFEAAIAADPKSESAYLDLVLLLDQLRRHDAAREAAARCVKAGVRWGDEWQRVAIYEPGLTARAWWDRAEFPWAEALELRHAQIKQELVLLMCVKGSRSGSMPNFTPVGSERGQHDADIVEGDWREFVIFGTQDDPEVDMYMPNTKAILEKQLPGAVAMAKLGAGEIIVSALAPGTHLVPHCASSNIRLTCHLGLICPAGARIRVGESWGTWQEGKCMFFDDSFEHEVVHEGKGLRIVLLIRFWHPELPEEKWLHTLQQGMKSAEELQRRRVTPPMSPAVRALVAEPMQKHLQAYGFGEGGEHAGKDPMEVYRAEAGDMSLLR
mmetsp:Transcript_77526/g.141865  ORF Transcript_77526/g.141865 Transcript_77526/m.141865 type:complete len:571 (+) Transcript_77526:71-1783(+)